MKVGELRVGNIISHEKCPIFRVDEIRLTENGYVARMYPFLGTDNPKVLDSWIDLPLRDAQPVVLTDEILRDWCGFKLEEVYGDPALFFWHGKQISLTDDFILSTANNMYSSSEVDGCTKILTLHRLQNLYYALTGEELEVKLPASV